MAGHSLLYIESGSPVPLTEIYWNMVLRNTEIKASIIKYIMINLVTTWIGPAVREKQRTADSRSTLFTFKKRSDWKCRSKDLPPACENKVNKMILCEVNMYL